MEIGAAIFFTDYAMAPTELAVALEERGFDSLWVAEKLVGEIRATHPIHVCFSFKVGATPHKAAMRSMELMMSEVRPRVERALGPPARRAAE